MNAKRNGQRVTVDGNTRMFKSINEAKRHMRSLPGWRNGARSGDKRRKRPPSPEKLAKRAAKARGLANR